MPSGLRRYQQNRQLHYITFTCYHRAPYLESPTARSLVEHTLERVRRWYGLYISAYVVIPEHVHVLMSEPERAPLSVAVQMWKQVVARRLLGKVGGRAFWQARYYDFNVWSEEKYIEKRQYIHMNPVRRGLVENAADWEWSSFRHHVTGIEGPVEIESQWTARKRERLGILPTITQRVE